MSRGSREGNAQNLVSSRAPAPVIGRRRMVEKIVGEQFLEHLEIPAALHFLGVPPNNCLAASLTLIMVMMFLQPN
jgi:hypothetical protein